MGQAGLKQDEPGYFIPEQEWAELEDAASALGAVTEMLDGPQRHVQMDSSRLGSLLRMFRNRMNHVRASARFVA